MQVHIKQMLNTDFLLANRFLKQHKQATAGKKDLLFAAVHEGKVIAAVWLTCPETSSHCWLRSLYVAEKHREKGIATELLSHIKAQMGSSEIFCFAQPDLEQFYLKNGFLEMDKHFLPDWLNIKHAQYSKHQSFKIYRSI